MNYTFDTQSSISVIDDKSVKGTKTYKQTAVVDQTMSSTKNTCIRFNFTVYIKLIFRIMMEELQVSTKKEMLEEYMQQLMDVIFIN